MPLTEPELIRYVCTLDSRFKNQLKHARQSVRLLKTIQTHDESLATPENERTLLALGSGSVLETGMIALILEYKSSQRALKGETYQPFLLKQDLIGRLAFEYHIEESIRLKKPFRYEFLLKHFAHVSSMQLDYDGETCYAFFIDASLDHGNVAYAERLQAYAQHRGSYTQGGIQYDSINCAVFGIQHLNALSNASLEERIRMLQPQVTPGPFHLSSPFLKHIQSLSQLPSYFKTHDNEFVDKKRQRTLEQHIQQHSIRVSDGAHPITKQKNASVAFKREKYLNKISHFFQGIDNGSPDDARQKKKNLHALIQKRLTFVGKNRYAPAEDLSEERIISSMLASFVNDNKTETLREIVQDCLSSGRFNLIFDLISMGATYDQLVGPRGSLIRRAISKGEIALVSALLDLAPDKNKDDQGRYYLFSLLEYPTEHTSDLLKMLLAYPLDPTVRDAQGGTLLHQLICVFSANPRERLGILFQQLLDASLDVNALNHNHQTPLAYLCSVAPSLTPYEESIKMFLKAGAFVTDLPKGYLTTEKLYAYFNEVIAEKDTKSFENLLAICQQPSVSISYEKLEQMVSQHRATRVFNRYFVEFKSKPAFTGYSVSTLLRPSKRSMPVLDCDESTYDTLNHDTPLFY